MNKKILFLDALPFDSKIQVGSHHYARLFRSAGYEVFSLSNYLNFLRFIRRKPEDREMIENYRSGVRVSAEGIRTYTPLCVLPYLNFPALNSLTLARHCLRFCFPPLGKMMDSFRKVDILFVNNIRLRSILRIVESKTIVLRITDRFDAFPNVPGTIVELEREMIRMADLVFVTSRKLQEEIRDLNPNTHYLPNGVAADFLRRPEDATPPPEEYRNLHRPIAVYVGAVSDWFDYELFEFGLSRLKDVSFVVIGPICGVNYRRNWRLIQRFSKTFPNFTYLGSKDFNELKPYLHHAAVGLIPFRVNTLTHEINPVKLFDYAASGLQTVASDMRELRHFRQLAALYSTHEEYTDFIRAATSEGDRAMWERVAVAGRNTWEARFELLVSKLQELER